MSTFINTVRLCISFFPAPIQVMLLFILAIAIICIIFKLVAMVLNAIPFL